MKNERYTKEEISKACMDRLEREFKLNQNNKKMAVYLTGYKEATENILWDLLKVIPKIQTVEEYSYKNIKCANINISDIKLKNNKK